MKSDKLWFQEEGNEFRYGSGVLQRVRRHAVTKDKARTGILIIGEYS